MHFTPKNPCLLTMEENVQKRYPESVNDEGGQAAGC